MEQALLKTMMAIRWLAVGTTAENKIIDQKLKALQNTRDGEIYNARLKACGKKFASADAFAAQDEAMKKAGGKKQKKWEGQKNKAAQLALKAELKRLQAAGKAAKKISAAAMKHSLKQAQLAEKEKNKREKLEKKRSRKKK
jgi:hypothetical protein